MVLLGGVLVRVVGWLVVGGWGMGWWRVRVLVEGEVVRHSRIICVLLLYLGIIIVR